MTNDALSITKEQALSCLHIRDGEVHSFLCSDFGLLGADMGLDRAKEVMDSTSMPEHTQIAGKQAQAMKHAIAVFDQSINDWYFLESDMEKVAELEAQLTAGH